MTTGMPTKTTAVFNALVQFAQASKTVTYKQVGDAVGLHWRHVNIRLYAIWQWCASQQPSLPHLNAIVVNGQTGRPGSGYTPHGHALTRSEFQVTKQQVFNYDWSKLSFPQSG